MVKGHHYGGPFVQSTMGAAWEAGGGGGGQSINEDGHRHEISCSLRRRWAWPGGGSSAVIDSVWSGFQIDFESKRWVQNLLPDSLAR